MLLLQWMHQQRHISLQGILIQVVHSVIDSWFVRKLGHSETLYTPLTTGILARVVLRVVSRGNGVLLATAVKFRDTRHKVLQKSRNRNALAVPRWISSNSVLHRRSAAQAQRKPFVASLAIYVFALAAGESDLLNLNLKNISDVVLASLTYRTISVV